MVSVKCLDCGEPIEGRVDKKFCSPYCKSNFHYKRNKEMKDNLFNKIDRQLKLNRRLLKDYNRAGKATVRKVDFLKEGFNPKYFTHYWRAKNKNLYLFCYEYGFMESNENNKQKYVLVEWQPYMER